MSRPQHRSQAASAAASQFGVEAIDDRPGRVRLVAEGELDLADFNVLNAALDDAAKRAPSVVLDITAVAFIDSSGLRAIVDAHHDAQRAGREFVLTAGTEAVERTLQISGLDGWFQREAPQQPENHDRRADPGPEDPLARDPLSPLPTDTGRRQAEPEPVDPIAPGR